MVSETIRKIKPFETPGVSLYMTNDKPEVNFAVVSPGDKFGSHVENYSQYKLKRAFASMSIKEAVSVKRAEAQQLEGHNPLGEVDEILSK